MRRMSASAALRFTVSAASWHSQRDALQAVRRAVFIEEQRVPEHLEWDAADERAHHVLAADLDGRPIGTGRLRTDCYIGRMAVLKAWRGRGVGRGIMDALLREARSTGCGTVRLHAQTHALDFYRRCGFAAIGDEFDDVGIPHRLMELTF